MEHEKTFCAYCGDEVITPVVRTDTENEYVYFCDWECLKIWEEENHYE